MMTSTTFTRHFGRVPRLITHWTLAYHSINHSKNCVIWRCTSPLPTILGPLSKLNVYIDTARRGIDVECELHFITRALPSLLHATFDLLRSWKVGRLGGGSDECQKKMASFMKRWNQHLKIRSNVWEEMSDDVTASASTNVEYSFAASHGLTLQIPNYSPFTLNYNPTYGDLSSYITKKGLLCFWDFGHAGRLHGPIQHMYILHLHLHACNINEDEWIISA
jgi:hypothetical protein